MENVLIDVILICDFSSVVYIFLRGCRHDDAQTNSVNAAGPRRDLAASWHEALDGGDARSAVPRATARLYEELGGKVDYRGKPHAPVYRASLAREPDARPALAIGDSLYHDIGGANRVGVDSLFVACGIHAADLGGEDGAIDFDRLPSLCEREGQTPTYAMARFHW